MNKYPDHVAIKLVWQGRRNLAANWICLFCIEGKCMSGKITEMITLEENVFQINVSFIEPSYFKELYQVGRQITLNEASIILGVGTIVEVFKDNLVDIFS